ncbi:HEAT repeat domain-containing protein [Cohnella thailandensis]|uniref:HEAT repeat domain-containing protein n=1 Tax=Cohnella thailandensis TaxID=557557 RepID=A0A841SUX8_9BACL|nr:HEAT repeat domain-containing protein [Cohnella thailandensis]MBB6634406.1 HEAT repeat domain-containing protein [Cohnella thailandensis]MBP1972094.1 hypothetical protein [Cohnella thailandensis]
MTFVLVFLLTAVSLALLATIYFYLLIRKWVNIRERNKRKKWYDEHSRAIDAFLFAGGSADSFVPRKKHHFEALENTFGDFLSNVRVEGDFSHFNDVMERYFVPWYREQLRSRSWSERMNALYFIHRFRLASMQPELIRHLSGKSCSEEEKHEIFLLLADFGYEGLPDLMGGSRELPTFLLNELMCRIVSQDKIDEYVERFEDLSAPWQSALLEAARELHLRTDKLQELLERLMSSDRPELRVKALKTLAALGHLSSIEAFLNWLETSKKSGEWDRPQSAGEKLMAARLMGSIRRERFLPHLQELIGDSAYGVRAEAARSLRQYSQGKRMLSELSVNHPDAYARSIAQEWIERNPDHE